MACDDPAAGDPGSCVPDRIYPDQSALSTCPASMASMAATRETFIEFTDREWGRVVGCVILAGASRPQAEDAVQEAFLQAWRLIEQRPDAWEKVRNPRGWIRVVALRAYRRPPETRREPPTMFADVLPDLADPRSDPAELTAQTRDVVAALGWLPDDLAAVMALSMEGFTSAEIGEVLGVTDQQVRDWRKQARGMLKRLWLGHMNRTGGELDDLQRGTP